jgi:hypothetical protein
VGAIEKLELLIKSFSFEELAQFREWFAEFDAQVWDSQIEADAAAGKLDRLIKESLADQTARNPVLFELHCVYTLLGALRCAAQVRA